MSAVMDVDYSPTGREFVAGGYDRSVRIFSHAGGHSREVYTTKRMQRVFAVKFSGDATYVFSGSDDMNVRVWKVRRAGDEGFSCASNRSCRPASTGMQHRALGRSCGRWCEQVLQHCGASAMQCNGVCVGWLVLAVLCLLAAVAAVTFTALSLCCSSTQAVLALTAPHAMNDTWLVRLLVCCRSEWHG